MDWFTVQSSEIVWAPIGSFVKKNGEEKTRFKRIGVRVRMMDGSWWFYSFTHNYIIAISLIAFVVMLFWFAWQQDRIDRQEGVAEDD